MKKTAIIVIVALASLTFAAPQGLKTEANRMNAEVAQAFVHKDMDAFEKVTKGHMTSDFKYVEAGQTYTFDQMVAQMKQSFEMMKRVDSCSAKSFNFSIHGNTATSETNHRMTAVMGGPDKKDHKMVMTGRSKDSYRKEGGVWKLAEMDWVTNKMTMDGKPFNPAMAGGGH